MGIDVVAICCCYECLRGPKILQTRLLQARTAQETCFVTASAHCKIQLHQPDVDVVVW